MSMFKAKLFFDNILHPFRIINAFGSTYINPLFGEHMPFHPSHIFIEPTTRCNLKCVFCPVPRWERARIKDMTLAKFKNVIRQFPYLVYLTLQGLGEPFMNKDIFKMLKYAKEKNISVAFNTNGTLLNKKKIEILFRNPPTHLTFSVDASKRETYIKIRGRNLLGKLVDNIRLTIQERNLTKSKCEISISAVLNKDNINELKGLVSLMKMLKADRLIIKRLSSWGKEEFRLKNKRIKVDCWKKRTKEIIEDTRAFAREEGIIIDINGEQKFIRENPCNAIKKDTYVTVDGEVVPCCVLGDPKIMSLGNIYAERFSDIWNNKRYRSFRKAINNHEIPLFCKDCYHKENNIGRG